MARLDARSNALRSDGLGGTRSTEVNSAPIAQVAPDTHTFLTEGERDQLKLAQLRAGQYDYEHGTMTSVYTTFEYRTSERINKAGQREAYTRRILHIHITRVPSAIVDAPIVQPEPPRKPVGTIRQDRAKLEAIAERLKKYRD